MTETKLKIKTYGEKVLREKAGRVAKISEEHRRILSQMSQTMYEGSGVGLAAPQVGISLQMIVVDIGDGLYKLINPRISKKRGRQAISEGCLSLPGISVKVKRAKHIRVSARNEEGVLLEIEASDLFACVLQHEIDHLKGKLIVDYASFLDKVRIKKKLSVLKKKTGQPG
ncbi:MAG: peptide deformylase [Candidatus Omnitrophica bacterium]|jgi:peptide deformylase|nr:peptide deformylase [Candidatus Omnitrophota bacterium]MDD5078602.1 peptide deformylase [Candidatus Omnitrophota bacterium]